MMHALFSFQGRLNRAPYWRWSLLIGLLMFGALVAFTLPAATQNVGLGEAKLQEALNESLKLPVVAVTALTLWPLLALVAKRLQDLDMPGWLAVPIMLPSTIMLLKLYVPGPLLNNVAWDALESVLLVIVIVATIWLGFVRGTRGGNRFGPDPLVQGNGPAGHASMSSR